MSDLVQATGLKKYFSSEHKGLFRSEKKFLHAVDGLDLNIAERETLGLVGESGCGKTTTGKLLVRLIEPTAGKIFFDGTDITNLKGKNLRSARKKMQIIFQDPYASLNPRKTVRQILSQPYKWLTFVARNKIDSAVSDLLELVDLSPPQLFLDRYPHELSGGQRQRIAIAKAIACEPKFVVADEPVSSLDISIRAQILELLKRLRRELGLTCLYITHDLSVVRSVCDRVTVMYVGVIIELNEVKRLIDRPSHPYTEALLSATPLPDPKLARTKHRIILKGEIPSPIDLPQGCRFHTRCPYKQTICLQKEPDLVEVRPGQFVRCHLNGGVGLRRRNRLQKRKQNVIRKTESGFEDIIY